MPNLFEQFNLVVFHKQRSYHDEISKKTAITGSYDLQKCY